jgi:dTDP-4-amino-4,6-dideoxygalactose transaminase
MSIPHFQGNFTQQEAIPDAAIERAISVMRSGRLHRYNIAPGERSEAVQLEREFADHMGSPYCLACASGGYALHIALRAYGLRAGEPVLTNAFTLSPVPGAIDNAGGKPVLVETDANLVIDLQDLAVKIRSSGAKVLLLSHMRGHIVDMDALCALLQQHQVALIEDCAHTMGAYWGKVKSGRHGIAACYSTQTYKHINSGEGGLLISDDAELMARATILSGSYMLYQRHETVPEAEVFRDIRLDTPNYSGRMDNLRAAILRPQLAQLDASCERWNERYRSIEQALQGMPGLQLPQRPPQERYVGSSIQFLIDDLSLAQSQDFLALCQQHGVELKWFGAAEPQAFTSRHSSWRYIDEQKLPQTDAILYRLFDMRIPLTFSVADCQDIAAIIRACLAQIRA